MASDVAAPVREASDRTEQPATSQNGISAGEPKKKKKKEKRAPDRPQPEWLFPADEENPVLNPKPVSEERARKDKEDWDAAVSFLQHKAVTAPMKNPPPGLLLTLIGAFLTSYGFHSASRLFSTHVAARARLDDWKTELGVKLPKGCPDLVKIFNDWHVDWEASRSSEDESDLEDSKVSEKVKSNAKDETSSSEEDPDGSEDSDSDSDSDSDVSMTDAPKVSKGSRDLDRSDTSLSSSDSDANDESGQGKVKAKLISQSKKLKRKEPSDKPSASGSSSASSSSASSVSDKAEPPTKKVKSAKRSTSQTESITTGNASKAIPNTSNNDLDSSREINGASAKKGWKKAVKTKAPKISIEDENITKSNNNRIQNLVDEPLKSNDSSTLEGSPIKEKAADSSSSSVLSSSSESPLSASPPPIRESESKKPKTKRKRSKSPTVPEDSGFAPSELAKKQNTPFQRIPQDIVVDPKLASNAYVPYDYADRAHKDLSVTKGKGFTKEKNKKKRGSYRGGQIDVQGKKAIKFDD